MFNPVAKNEKEKIFNPFNVILYTIFVSEMNILTIIGAKAKHKINMIIEDIITKTFEYE